MSNIEAKPRKTPEETIQLVHLKQESSTARNEEMFMNFSLNGELKRPSKPKEKGQETKDAEKNKKSNNPSP